MSMKQVREPLTGFIASVTVKGGADISTIVEPIQQHLHLMDYFWVGVLGSIGGLLVKLIWSYLKRRFPNLKNIDQ